MTAVIWDYCLVFGILTFACAYLISGIDQPRSYVMQWLKRTKLAGQNIGRQNWRMRF